MKIGDHAEQLALGGETHICPVYIWDDDNRILIDAGLPNQTEAIAEALASIGADINSLTHIILSHQDMDHIGGVNAIRELCPGLVVMAMAEEIPYIQGDLLSSKHKGDNPPPIDKSKHPRVDQALSGGQLISTKYATIEVVPTPGHTPGHICLYLRETQTLIAGDAMVGQEGKLMGPMRQYCADYEAAVRVLSRLGNLQISQVACYHGGLVRAQGLGERIIELSMTETC